MECKVPLGDITKYNSHIIVPQIPGVDYLRGQARLDSGLLFLAEKRSWEEVYRMFPQEWLGCLVEKSEHSQLNLKYFGSEMFLRGEVVWLVFPFSSLNWSFCMGLPLLGWTDEVLRDADWGESIQSPQSTTFKPHLLWALWWPLTPLKIRFSAEVPWD